MSAAGKSDDAAETEEGESDFEETKTLTLLECLRALNNAREEKKRMQVKVRESNARERKVSALLAERDKEISELQKENNVLRLRKGK